MPEQQSTGQAAGPTTSEPAAAVGGLDVYAVLADMQAQLDELRRAVQAQQLTIDALTDATIDLLNPADADR